MNFTQRFQCGQGTKRGEEKTTLKSARFFFILKLSEEMSREIVDIRRISWGNVT